tara:strand:- start:121 stop:594 length:474 start_codon:yes stop_codon:yes gene_type:complete
MTQQIVIHSQGRPTLTLPPALQLLLSGDTTPDDSADVSARALGAGEDHSDPATIPPSEGERWFAPPKRRDPESITDEEIKQVLALHQWRFKPAATALGIARSTLYKRVEESNIIRLATELSDAEIQAALDAHDGNVRQAAATLEVSLRGLQMRLKTD